MRARRAGQGGQAAVALWLCLERAPAASAAPSQAQDQCCTERVAPSVLGASRLQGEDREAPQEEAGVTLAAAACQGSRFIGMTACTKLQGYI